MDRTLFPALGERIWLNWATTPPGAAPVVDALDAANRSWADGSFSWRAWEQVADETRPIVARILGVDEDTIALTTTVAEAAATVARSLPPGRVVVGSREFRSNLFPWLQLARSGFEVVEARATADGVVPTDAVCDAITPETVLVAVTEVQSSNGYRVDVERIAEQCRRTGTRLFVNLTQSLGVVRFDAARVRPDYIAVHGYKWLLGVRGAAWLHVRPDRIDETQPLAPSWKTPPDPYEDYYGGPFREAPGARKLDLPLAWLPWVGTRAALDVVTSLDAAAVEERALSLAARFRTHAAADGHRLVPQELPTPTVGMALDDSEAAKARLEARGIAVAVRSGFLRVAFHAFNDESDVEACLGALRRSPSGG